MNYGIQQTPDIIKTKEELIEEPHSEESDNVENRMLEERKELIKDAKKHLALMHKYASLPKKIRVADILLIICTVTLPLLVTIPVFVSAMLVQMYTCVSEAAKLFREKGKEKWEKTARQALREIIICGVLLLGSLLIIALASSGMPAIVKKNILPWAVLFPFATFIGVIVAKLRFFEVRKLVNSFMEDEPKIREFLRFEADNDRLIALYLTIEGRTLITEFRNRHPKIFEEFKKLEDRRDKACGLTGVQANNEEFDKVIAEMNLFAEKYPEIFAEYKERINGGGFTRDEMAVTQKHLEMSAQTKLTVEGDEFLESLATIGENHIFILYLVVWLIIFFSYGLFGAHFTWKYLLTLFK